MTGRAMVDAAIPYTLTRAGVVMQPRAGDPLEIEGVLNPGSGRGPDGRLYLLPRLVGAGNRSRIGLAEVLVESGAPVGVERRGVVLAPERRWEHGAGNGGVEDPRITYLPVLGLHVMTYIAYGPLGPRPAIAVSSDLVRWRRLGPIHFGYDDALDADLNLYANKDVVVFPDVVPDPYGRPSLAALHRPMWDLGMIRQGEGQRPPGGIDDDRPAIWISYIDLEAVLADVASLTRFRDHREVARPRYDWEALKIGAGPPPIRVAEGWLLLHHGVSGTMHGSPLVPQTDVSYAAGAMLLDPSDPSSVLARSIEPLLEPETPDEVDGTVPRVVFPTAIEAIDDRLHVFYGMADSRIGVALLDRIGGDG